ncbi:ferredoxin-NADP reductase [Psychrobacter sp. PL15]|uniref:flavin reductase family protein n=1 Tax=Psychrobacter sp. PL15 TaxID=3071719 RepID=UPI002E0735AA|nr:ferredoxin-NADP reductase [Psychrobacter sp. PL15]
MPSGYRPEIIQRSFIDFIGSQLHPFRSLSVPKLRLIARRALGDDLIALQFEPNRAFKKQAVELRGGWHGGQHINLSVVIDGIYHQRSYSLVGLPQQPIWLSNTSDDSAASNGYDKNNQRHTVTIAIKPQGLISNYLTQHLPLGTVLASSVPNGDFTLEQARLTKPASSSVKESSFEKQSPLLFIAGGSGITPMLGLITEALQYGHKVTLLYYNRASLLESPFQNHWQHLAAKYPLFSYYCVNTEDSSTYLAGTRHLNASSLLALDLPLADTVIFACGSQALLTGLYRAATEITLPNVHSLTAQPSLRDNIIIERFGNAVSDPDIDQVYDTTADIEERTVYLRGRQQQFNTSDKLLMGAEDAGIRLTYGCRQGICQLCRCNKVSGVVKNIQTGKISSDGYESIQTCINVAMTDVVLDI